jgi:HSP20 family protein
MAEIVRWEPMREMTSLRDAMDRLFEDAFIHPGFMAPAWGAAEMLPVDVYEAGDQVVVKAAVPGVKPEELEVTVTGDLLTIKGEFKQEEKVEKPNYLRQERRYGSFCRQVGLPAGVNPDKASASFQNGVLTLEIPKSEAAKTKTVKVVAN